ncbi:methionine adenosyltransferase [Desulfatiglans anilini]|uniref:methionine adenosyltransferase n=1 Tax=Desulfatiglans anilini TaxID=90728 RepID=UPI00041BD6AC|nr:methionine adenosyltransferase [Desulfatiglans anilini]
MRKDYTFISESVTEGHPDKLCDQISDAIVDHFLMQDPCALVRAECAVSSAILFIGAHFATSAKVDLPHVARKVIKRIGYDQPDFNSKTCSILTAPQGRPPEKKALFDEHALTEAEIDRITSGEQGTVFGFACDQTSVLMPLPIVLAHKLAYSLTGARTNRDLPYLMPDGKVQIGVEFKNGRPSGIHSIAVTASQRDVESPPQKRLRDDIVERVIGPSFEDEEIKPSSRTKLFINPDGVFTGGPSHHSGLTGRKNAVDTYGNFSRHSGNALSGKGPMRIDRIGAYAARYAAKNVVAAGLATDCEVALSYSIGITQPVSLQVETFGTGKYSNEDLGEIVRRNFDFRLAGILRHFNLRHLPTAYPEGFYQRIAAYGHFGRTDIDLPWEKTDKAEILKGDL